MSLPPILVDTEPQSKTRESVKEKKVQKRYDEEFKRQAVELVIHSGKTQAQIARELGVSEYADTLEKRLPWRWHRPPLCRAYVPASTLCYGSGAVRSSLNIRPKYT
jgi:hypothetical protein